MAALLKHFQVQVPVNSLDAAYLIIDPTTSDSVQLSKCSEEKDLGIWYISDLKPSTQCRKVVAKATVCKH